MAKLAKDNAEATEQQRAVAVAAAAAAAATAGATAASGSNDAAAVDDDLSDFTGGIASDDDLGDEDEQEERMEVDAVVSKLSGDQKAAVQALLDKRRVRRCRQTQRNKKPEDAASAARTQRRK